MHRHRLQAAARFAGLLVALVAAPALGQDVAEQRRAMVDTVAGAMADNAPYTDDGGVTGLSDAVREALLAVPRHRFVPEGRRDAAYANRPLPIGYGQTISQPYVVALMTELLALEPAHRVLELGTGSGYQSAVAAELAAAVYSVEIVPALAERAADTLAATGYDALRVRQGDGYHGWPEHAPFDAIIITAAVDHIPPPLLEQLKPGGRLILPLGDPFGSQVLTLVRKAADGSVTSDQTLPVRFVPLTRGGDG